MTGLAVGRTSAAFIAATKSDGEFVVRVPIPDTGRLLSYWPEAEIGDQLGDLGLPVARWEVVEVDGFLCSVALRLPGEPVAYDADWTPEFANDVAVVLNALHNLPATGWGPLANRPGPLCGTSASRQAGIVDRWFHAQIWPFDDSDLEQHPVSADQSLCQFSLSKQTEIIEAAEGQFGLTHSDLHRLHFLTTDQGKLGGVLDFGDTFVGAVAWDFALLIWYYGEANAAVVAGTYPEGVGLLEKGRTLAIAVGLYKWAKAPSDPWPPDRLRQMASHR